MYIYPGLTRGVWAGSPCPSTPTSAWLAELACCVTGVTAASSGTHTCWCRKQASSLALSSAPVAAGQASSLALWRARQRDVSIPEGDRGDTGRGLRGVLDGGER